MELEKITKTVEGTVSTESVKLSPGIRSTFQVQYPGLKGTFKDFQCLVNFSIISDFSQRVAGQPINKPTPTHLDYLYPWLQVYVYNQCPFILWITPKRKDVMTKITRAIGLISKGLKSGVSEFDNRYFLDCRSGKTIAESFIKKQKTMDKIEALGKIEILRFEETYIKLVTSIEKKEDYKAEKVIQYIRVLSDLAETLHSMK
jgi:hypothetical protein